jgi:hypothetical protein
VSGVSFKYLLEVVSVIYVI